MWTLIVLIVGTLPPQGMQQHGFDTKQDCLLEATVYCWPPQARQFICKCEWGIKP